jgi:non-homologous end joining protein Ku
LTAPVTIGKATAELRERGLVTVCWDHGVPIDRTERCGAGHDDCTLAKSRAVAIDKGDDGVEYRVLNRTEVAAIEDSTKSSTLDVEDVQPLKDLPMVFSMGTYYLRADAKVRGSEQAFAILHAALATTRMGLVVKWCRSATQDLCVIHAAEGMLLLTKIPMLAELRKPGDQERAHWKVDVPQAQIDLATDLLKATRNSDGFQWADYEDEGYKLRAEAVDRILAGEQIEDEPEDKPEPKMAPDIMAELKAALAEATA